MVDEPKLEIRAKHSYRPSKIRVSLREENYDRLSDLPDSLLLYILSYMSVIDAISTSILSKRWRNLWKWIDILDFPLHCSKLKNSVQFIERTLSLYEGLKIKTFCARACYNSNYISQIDSWVSFAVVRNVEKLVLDLFCVENGVHPYVIPEIVYKSGSLRELEVNLCRFFPPSSFCLRFLSKLVINNTVFVGDSLKILVSGCPVLEELVLVNCNRALDLDVVILNRSVERMKIVEFHDELEEGTEVRICAPFILHLEIESGDPRPYVIDDVSSIVSACIDIRRKVTCLSFNSSIEKNYFKIGVNIMAGLHQVKTLRLSSFCVQAMLTHEDKPSCLQTPLQKLNHLKLDVQLTKDELPGIASLLRSSPELHTLTIHLCRQAYMDTDSMDPTENKSRGLSDWSDKSFWDCHEKPLYNLICNLKKV